jgi:hypothetical protein
VQQEELKSRVAIWRTSSLAINNEQRQPAGFEFNAPVLCDVTLFEFENDFEFEMQMCKSPAIMWLFALIYAVIVLDCFVIGYLTSSALIGWLLVVAFHAWSLIESVRHTTRRSIIVTHDNVSCTLTLVAKTTTASQLQQHLESAIPSLSGCTIRGLCSPDGGPVMPLWLLAQYPCMFNSSEAQLELEPTILPVIDHSCFVAPDTISWDALCEQEAAQLAFAQQIRCRGFALLRMDESTRLTIKNVFDQGQTAFQVFDFLEIQICVANLFDSSSLCICVDQKLPPLEKNRHSFRGRDLESIDMGFQHETNREYYEHRQVIDAHCSAAAFRPPSVSFAAATSEAFARLNTVAIMCYSLLCESVPGLNTAAALSVLDEECVDLRMRPKVSSSCFRLHRYTPRDAVPIHQQMMNWLQSVVGRSAQSSDAADQVVQQPHVDLGLITIAPRGSCIGLQVAPFDSVDWVNIEEHMHECDLVVFCASALAHASRQHYRPLLHRAVRLSNQPRLSMPFFLRGNPRARIDLQTLYGSEAASLEADAVPLLHDTGPITLQVGVSGAAVSPANSHVMTVHDLMAQQRRARNLTQLHVPWMRWSYGFLQPVIASRAPQLEWIITPNTRV